MTSTTASQPAAYRVVLAATTTALAVNLLLYALGRVAGGDFSYQQAGKATPVGVVAICILTVSSMTAGLGFAFVVMRRWPKSLPVLQLGAAVIAVASVGVMTIPADFDATSTVFLAAMHLTAIPIALSSLPHLRTPQPHQAWMS